MGVVVTAGVAAPARAQERLAATVTSVVDGDTVRAQLAGGPSLEVQLIGIDTPELDGCGGVEATDYMKQVALGRNVTLVDDPTQPSVDQSGRSLFYLDRDDGLDVGQEMLRAGWAQIFGFDSDFQRLPAYLAIRQTAERFPQGVFYLCSGRFHEKTGDESRQRRRSAIAFVRRYYRRISSNRFGAAWGMLSHRVRRDFGPFGSWKVGYRRSLRTTVPFARARMSGRRAVVSVRLRARDRDACSGRVVQQRFRGKWTLAPRRDSWVGVKVRMRKTGGGRPRLSRTECAPTPPLPPPPPPPTGPRRDCQGYSPCLPPGPDVDCRGGSGNGPRYVDGPVSVKGSDPYGLDDDGDGVGCE
jgi:endonuclease YncB( thermonuclease family)